MNKRIDKPKRGMTVFFHYLQDNRDRYKREHPELVNKHVVRELSRKWRLMSDQEKRPYYIKAKIDQQNYWRERNATTRPKDKNFPKKGMCSFFHFLQTKREETMIRYPHYGHRQIIVKLGEEWRAMTQAEKQPYYDLAINDQFRYEQDKRNFNFMKNYNNFYEAGIDFVIELPRLCSENNGA